jgi:replicative DNA helicase
MAGGRPPPQDLAAEESLLGAMLLTSAAIEASVGIVTHDSYYSPAHGHIHHAIVGLYDRGEPVDPITVADELRRAGLLEAIGGPATLISLQANVGATTNAGRYARIVENHAHGRRLISVGHEIVELGHGHGEDPGLTFDLAQGLLSSACAPRGAAAVASRLTMGGGFVLDGPTETGAVWGADDAVLWAAGESCLIVGPTGVGKTTLALQLVAGRLGLLTGNLLGWPVQRSEGRTLYLAMDRPSQMRRAMRRVFTEADRAVLDEQLVIWRGPLTHDLGRRPETLLELARAASATTVVIDSLKDAAVKISDDETGGNLNRAMQLLVTEGIDVLGLHHQRKGQGGARPKTLEDVYGSTWITAGAGSVILLWGAAGDPIVELTHLKQPAAEVGPLQIEHDHAVGISTVFRGFDALRFLNLRASTGATVIDAARAQFEKTDPSDNEQRKTRRLLDSLVTKRVARRQEPVRGGAGGATAARYYPLDTIHHEEEF